MLCYHFHEPQNSPESPLDRYHRCCLAQSALSRTLYCGCHSFPTEFIPLSLLRPFPDSFPTVFQQFSDSFPTVFRQFSDSFLTVFRQFSDSFPRLANVIRLFSDSFPTVFRQFSDIRLFSDSFPTVYDSLMSSDCFPTVFLSEVNVEEKSVLLGFHNRETIQEESKSSELSSPGSPLCEVNPSPTVLLPGSD